MNILTINTSDNTKVIVGLKLNSKEFKKEEGVKKDRKQEVLQLMDTLLKEHKLKPSDLNSIEVNIGPGSFTGIRVGISVANALSFVLKIPVNNNKIGVFVESIYQ